MQQRLGGGSSVKIAGLAPEKEIEEINCTGARFFGQLSEVEGQQTYPPGKQAGANDDQQGRENPAKTPRVKIEQTKPSALEITQQNASDQIARNNEEDIDAHENTGQPKVVVGNDQCDGKRSQAIDIGPICSIGVCVVRHGMGRSSRRALDQEWCVDDLGGRYCGSQPT